MQNQPIDNPENWGAASKGYAEKIAPVLMKPFCDHFLSSLDLKEEHDVLEVAAGSGIFTIPLSRKVNSVLATDFAQDMINVISSETEKNGIENVSLAVMDGQDLQIEDSSFERVICCFGLMLFPDRAKGFSEIHRVLKPGGKALISGWADPSRFESFALFLQALNTAIPDLPPPPAPPPVFSLADLDSFKSEMKDAGFKDIEVSFVPSKTLLDDFEQTWDMLTIGAPPVRLLFDQVGEEKKEDVREALKTIMEEKYGTSNYSLNNTATLGIASK